MFTKYKKRKLHKQIKEHCFEAYRCLGELAIRGANIDNMTYNHYNVLFHCHCMKAMLLLQEMESLK